MNLRELWDTVVLRDILGYIFPGAVTLLAMALCIKAATGWHPVSLIDGVVGYLHLRELAPFLAPPWEAWVFAASVVPISYVLGHLQAWALEFAEERTPSWHLGRITLDYLIERGDFGETYANAACAHFCKRGHKAGLHPLVLHLRGERRDREKRRQDQLSPLCEQQRSQEEAKQKQVQTQTEARELWRLCDRYVFDKDRDLHSMFMGRYYVLAVLFTNLGVSSIMLGFAGSALLLRLLNANPAGSQIAALWAVPLAAVVLGYLNKGKTTRFLSPQCGCELTRSVLAGAVFVAVVCLVRSLGVDGWNFLSSGCIVVGTPVALGMMLVRRSHYFRQRFVECTFPIFYAIVQGDKRSEAGQA
ncbi:MAG TPA: hypothetical protein VM537_21485 [Anaerolineae bacterium]|nr:hypothetical protein [Anaerolineae bacterium]